MSTTTVDTVQTQPMAQRLKDKGIGKIVIIDDCFDPPTRADYQQNEIAYFLGDVTEDESPENYAKLEALLGKVPEDESQIRDEDIRAIFDNQTELGPLQKAFEQRLLPTIYNKRQLLSSFSESLRDEFGLQVNNIGTHDSVQKGAADIIFLDYYLGETGDPASVLGARQKITALMAQYELGEKKPLVVLMSSETVVEDLAEEFRDRTQILGGMFYFIPKMDINDHVRLQLHLSLLIQALPTGHKIQQFTDAVEKELNNIKAGFLATVRGLNLDDYNYIKRLSLQEEGHPLGDYLLWLFSSYLGHQLFEQALQPQRVKLDALKFNHWMPSHMKPSKHLAMIYQSALYDTSVEYISNGDVGEDREENVAEVGESTESTSAESLLELSLVGDIGEGKEEEKVVEVERSVRLVPQPLSLSSLASGGEEKVREGVVDVKKSTESTPTEPLPLLKLGDVFINDGKNLVQMVMNPACDLMPREPDPQLSIIFILGELGPLGRTPPQGAIQTDLLVHNDQQYSVLWKPKRLQTVPHGRVDTWLQQNGYCYKARLRMPFSLEIQNHATSTISRVGTPISPVLSRPLTVTVFEKGTDNQYVEIPIEQKDRAVFSIESTSSVTNCRLGSRLIIKCQQRLKAIIEQESEHLIDDVSSLDKDTKKRQKRLRSRLAKANALLIDESAWLAMSDPFPLPTSGSLFDFSELGIKQGVAVGNNSRIDKRWDNSFFLILQLGSE